MMVIDDDSNDGVTLVYYNNLVFIRIEFGINIQSRKVQKFNAQPLCKYPSIHIGFSPN